VSIPAYRERVATEDLKRLQDVYTRAWEERDRSGSTDDETLVAQLRAHELDAFADVGPLRDVVLGAWHRSVPPSGLDRALRRAAPGLALIGIKGLATTAWEIKKLLRGTEWTWVDTSWLDLPPGHQKLTDARHSFDLARRWFYPGVEELSLPVDLDESDDESERLCRTIPSANRAGWYETPVWLRLGSRQGHADVMVGQRRVGHTRLPIPAWRLLEQEARNSTYADGSLLIPWGDDSRSATPELNCYVPK